MGFDAWLLAGIGRFRRGLRTRWDRCKRWALDSDRERPVLPGHYSSLLYTDPTSYPGHCPACGTDNEPRYQYCADCGAELPSPGEFGDAEDLRGIFGE